MRKLQLLILAAAVAAGAIWWAFYRTHHTSSLGVASLLPKETLFVFEMSPRKTREEIVLAREKWVAKFGA